MHDTKFDHGAPIKFTRIALAVGSNGHDDERASDGGAQGIGRFGDPQGSTGIQKYIAQDFNDPGIEIELFRELRNFCRDDVRTRLFQLRFPHFTPRNPQH